MSEREKIIALARECNIQSLKEPRYHMDIYELTGQAIEAFYHKAQREALVNAKVSIPTDTMEQTFQQYHTLGYKKGKKEAFKQAAKVCESCIRPTLAGVFDREDAAYTNAAKAIQQLIKE